MCYILEKYCEFFLSLLIIYEIGQQNTSFCISLAFHGTDPPRHSL